MFVQQLGANGQGSLSRPFVLCIILILLFLSLQTDITSTAPSIKRSELRGGHVASLKDGVKEQILMQLSLTQEKLELENKRLKQYVLDLRRAMRSSGCEVNASTHNFAFVFPELASLADEHFAVPGHPESNNTLPAESNHVPAHHHH